MKLITHMSYVLHVENVFFTHIMFKGNVTCLHKITLQDVIICIKIMAVVLRTLEYIHLVSRLSIAMMN
jgi:hypothetical protein